MTSERFYRDKQSLGALVILLSIASLPCRVSAQDFLDSGTQGFDMHICPSGSAMGGANVGKNQFMCRQVDEPQQDCFVDYGSQRQGMHACPSGSYMKGLRDDRNELLCCFDRQAGRSNLTSESVDGGTQGYNMHICTGQNASTVMTGIDTGANRFLCASKSSRFAASPLPTTPQDPAQARNFLRSPNGTQQLRAAWQFATWNWLAHILEVAQIKGYNPPALGGSGSAVAPPPPSPTVSPATMVEGTQQFVIQYASPIDGSQEQAYLILPPNYIAGHRYPAVLVTHGHGDACKDSLARNWNDPDHAAALYMAQQGAIALAPDTRSFCAYQTAVQGGRDHTAYTASTRLGTLPQEYLLDNLVRISYLASRPDVDTTQIFTAGLSLGAYQAMWTAAMDDRVAKVVVGDLFLDMKCLNSDSDNGGNHACQTIPAISTDYIQVGGNAVNGRGYSTMISQQSLLIDSADLAALIAPRPMLIVWGQSDPFFTSPTDCTTRAATQGAQVYSAFGVPSNFVEALIPGMQHNFEDYTSAQFLLGRAGLRRDYGTQQNGVRSCNANEGMVGIRSDKNEYLCLPATGPLSCKVDASGLTQRDGMHACPVGSFMQGADLGSNSFICCTGPQASAGSEFKDLGSQTEGMHACPQGGGENVFMSGLQNQANQILCSTTK
jgi:dienelactone hydrolase